MPEDYVRHLEYKGQEVALASDNMHVGGRCPAPKSDAFRALFSAKNSRPTDRAAGGIAGKNGKIAGL